MLIALAFVPLLALAAPKQLIDLQVYPKDANLFTKRGKQLMVVQASYSDGTRRDVTDLALLRSSNESCAAIGTAGQLTSADPGETYITASFGVHTVGVPVVVLSPEPVATLLPSGLKARELEQMILLSILCTLRSASSR